MTRSPLPQTSRSPSRLQHAHFSNTSSSRRKRNRDPPPHPGPCQMAGERRGPGATRARLLATLLAPLLAPLLLLTCGVRCAAAGGGKPSNIILILADDQDVHLGGMTPMKKTRALIGDAGATFVNAVSRLMIHSLLKHC
ncbi:N-acetylglucosamine-6-sulfatase [Liparis tanakae]|uniref:N-acetylglucosamine-6-sulfatase n=1 Tax=Liparis tanakae TaxID=230148 RepID=A0A4Z2EE55_9TELE|nr:N-acetylglucosamine-6-sulfatase [Liparis tanakae]